MKTLTLLRKAVQRVDGTPTNRLDLEVTAAQDITPDVFVKQRYTKFDGTIEEVFAAVASPANLEDIDVQSPAEGSSYFRTNTISLVSSDAAYLEEAFNNILHELRLLCDQAEILDEVTPDAIYSITSTGVVKNPAS